MYLLKENFDENGKLLNYQIDEKINGNLIESHYISTDLKSCSCKYFAESNNPYTHFHINLCKHWIKEGKPMCAMYAKSKKGKIVTLCPGFIKIS